MTCPSVEQLRRFLDDGLSDSESSAVVGHVAECAECQQQLDELTGSDVQARAAFNATEPGLRSLIEQLRERPIGAWSAMTSMVGSGGTVQFAGPVSDAAPLGWLGTYQIERELGSGTTGQVFAARDSRLGRRVAIKVLRPQWACHAAARSRFEREARAVAALEDERIVKVFEVGETPDGSPFIVMEFVDGESLDARLKRDRSFSPRESASIAQQIALGLDAAHRRGIVHRDVKPGNVLLSAGEGRAGRRQPPDRTAHQRVRGLTPSGSPNLSSSQTKLADFGLARVPEATESLTQEGFIAGTPAYMSPEQIRRPQEADARSDVYSVGVLLYEMLTDERPFRGVVRMVLHQALHEEPVPPRRLNDRVPRDLETICLKAMSKEPSQRYGSAMELAEDLRRWLNGEPVHARPVGPVGRAWRWCRRNPKLAILNAVVVAVLLAGAFDAARYLQPSDRWRHEAEVARREAATIQVEAEQHHNERLRLIESIVSPSDGPIHRESLTAALHSLQNLRSDESVIPLLAATQARLVEMCAVDGSLDKSLAQSLWACEQLGAIAARDEATADQLRAALAGTGRRVNGLLDRQDFESARSSLVPAAEWATRLWKSHDVTFADGQAAALVFRNLAIVESHLGQPDDAKRKLDEFESILTTLEGRASATPTEQDWLTLQRRELPELRKATEEM